MSLSSRQNLVLKPFVVYFTWRRTFPIYELSPCGHPFDADNEVAVPVFVTNLGIILFAFVILIKVELFKLFG